MSTLYKGIQADMKLPDGKTWMWPFNKSVLILFYNADLMAKDGQSEPKTWDDYASVMKAVSKDGVTGSTSTRARPRRAYGTQWFEILPRPTAPPCTTPTAPRT